MKGLWSILLPALLLASCHKNDVDISTLDTNMFDADHVQDPAQPLFTVDTILTVDVNQGVLIEQHAVVRVHPERFSPQVPYEVWMVEHTVPEVKVYPGEADNTILCRNFTIQLGTTYCYTFELHAAGQRIAQIDRCALAEL